jgi:hypothetical protein
MAGQDPPNGARCGRRTRGVLSLLLFWLLVWPAFWSGVAGAQDTPEMLAAMRASLPPVPEQVPDFDSLPAELRRQIPPIRIQGHRWHADPSQRFVQIDGRRVTEDGVAGQELWLRQIRRDSVVMQFRDSLFLHSVKVGN